MNEQTLPLRRPVGSWTALLGGIIVVLIAQFALDRLADTSDVMHWTQHGLLFAGGLVAGVGAANLYRSSQRLA